MIFYWSHKYNYFTFFTFKGVFKYDQVTGTTIRYDWGLGHRCTVSETDVKMKG